jgi:hypothetical protein
MEQEQTVYCLLEGRDVFAVMPMGIACRTLRRQQELHTRSDK